MPRDERIEEILAAWYETEECEPQEIAKWRDQRNNLVDQVIAGTRSCRQELLEALERQLRRLAHPEVPEDVWTGFEEAEDGRGIEMRDEHFDQPPA